MKNKCTCLRPQVSCFSGLCIYCNRIIKPNVKSDFFKIVDAANKNIGTFCDKCRQVYCVCNINKIE